MDLATFIGEQRSILGRQEAVARLARATAHELNNILQSLSVNHFFIRENLDPDSQAAADLAEAEKAATHLTNLSHNLRSVGRPPEITLYSLGLESRLNRVLEEWHGRATDTARVELRLPALPDVRVDGSAMDQVLTVILEQAVQSSESRPAAILIVADLVEVPAPAVEALGWLGGHHFVRLGLCHEGAPVAAELRERVFDPNFPARDSHSASPMGLAFVWRMLHAMGGFVHFQDRAPRTELSLFLPVAGKAADHLAALSPRPLAEVLAAPSAA